MVDEEVAVGLGEQPSSRGSPLNRLSVSISTSSASDFLDVDDVVAVVLSRWDA